MKDPNYNRKNNVALEIIGEQVHNASVTIACRLNELPQELEEIGQTLEELSERISEILDENA
jgi:hypothetical protein